MSYQVLARKWRPKSFEEVVGQEHVLKVLSNALSLGRVHHAYLFSGTRGVGKTSIARLLAKGLNCESGITATPCGKCDNCLDIEQGRFVDLIEIDAASRTKVEDTREILDNIQYLPTKGRFKVYLIDEVHMLSRSSFNALLKTLEEPPEHVKFLLATTDPQKLPITILSRCLHLHLNMLDTTLISAQLTKILKAEQIDSETKAIKLLAKAADGSMRDALSLTDQAIALGNGRVDADSVSVMLGTLDKAIPFALVDALYKGEGNTLMQHIDAAAKQGADWNNLLAESITLLHQIALLQVVPSALGDYSEHEEEIRFLAQYMAPNDVQLFYQILLMGKKELAFAPDKKIGVEMSFLRALAFMPKANEVISVQTVTPKPQANMPLNVELVPAKHYANNTEVAKIDAKSVPQMMPVSNSEPDLSVPEEAPAITKNILEMRRQLIQGEQHSKKSQLTEVTQSQILITETLSANKTIINNHSSNGINLKEDISEDNDRDSDNDDDEITAENYQWQATTLFERKNELAIDSKLFRETTDKTPEMVQKLIDEIAQQDSWSNEIEHLEIPPLIKQIAINAFIEQLDNNVITLHLRSTVKHLINTSSNITKLEQALSLYRQQNIKLNIIIDDSVERSTPLEMREALYQQKITQAKQKITQDDKIAMICQFFEAQIDEESVRPV